MRLSPGIKKSIESQRSEIEGEYKTSLGTVYPFSLQRTMVLILSSIALSGAVLWAWLICIRFLRQPMEVKLQKLGTMLGPGFAAEGCWIVLFMIMFFTSILVIVTISLGLLPRIKRTMYINVFREAIEIVDSIPLFHFKKKYILIQDVETAAVTKDQVCHWLEVTTTGGETVRFMVAEDYEDKAQDMVETIENHRARLDKMKKAGDGPAWKKKLAEFVNRDEFDKMDHDEKYAMVRTLLEEIAAEYESMKIITRDDYDAKANVTGERFELRMKRKGTPVRVIMGGHGTPIIETKPGLKKGSFSLYQDEEMIPKERNAADPWSESDGQIVFVAKEVFTTDDDVGTVKDTLAALGEFPRQVLEELLAGMEDQGCNLFYLQGDSDALEAYMIPIYVLKDPVKEIRDMINYLAGISTRIGSKDYKIPKGGPKIFEFTNCDYCGSRYTFGLVQQCPNCGSPP